MFQSIFIIGIVEKSVVAPVCNPVIVFQSIFIIGIVEKFVLSEFSLGRDLFQSIFIIGIVEKYVFVVGRVTVVGGFNPSSLLE